MVISPIMNTSLVVNISLTPSNSASSSTYRVRFLGYAGTPFILTIPCFFLSVKSILRIHKTNKHLKRSRHHDMDFDHLSPLPRVVRIRDPPRAHSSVGTPSVPFTPTTVGPDSSPASPRMFHIPFSSTPAPTTTEIYPEHLTSSMSTAGGDDRDSIVSTSFPTFANPLPRPGAVISEIPQSNNNSKVLMQDPPKDDWREILATTQISHEDDRTMTVNWKNEIDVKQMKTESDFGDDATDENDYDHYIPRHVRRHSMGGEHSFSLTWMGWILTKYREKACL